MNILAIIFSTLAGLGGLAGLVSVFYIRPTYNKLSADAKKAGAETSQLMAEGTIILMEPLQKRILELNREAGLAWGEVDRLRRTLQSLEDTLTREREASQARIRDLEGQVATRDIKIRILEAHPNSLGELPT